MFPYSFTVQQTETYGMRIEYISSQKLRKMTKLENKVERYFRYVDVLINYCDNVIEFGKMKAATEKSEFHGMPEIGYQSD